MITVPNRLAEMRQKLESGQSISAHDIRRAEMLMSIDLVEAGRRAAEEAVMFHESENELCLATIRAMAK